MTNDSEGVTSNSGTDANGGFCFRCTRHVSRKPCATSHGPKRPNTGPDWLDKCPNAPKDAGD